MLNLALEFEYMVTCMQISSAIAVREVQPAFAAVPRIAIRLHALVCPSECGAQAAAHANGGEADSHGGAGGGQAAAQEDRQAGAAADGQGRTAAPEWGGRQICAVLSSFAFHVERAPAIGHQRDHRHVYTRSFTCCDYLRAAGDAIASTVLASPLFEQHSRFGVFVHAERLREVDTTAILDTVLSRGQC